MPIKRVYAGPGSTATAPVLYIDDDSGSSALNAELVAELAALDPATNPCVTIAGKGTAGDQGGGVFVGALAVGGPPVDNIFTFLSANAVWLWTRDVAGKPIDPRWAGFSQSNSGAANRTAFLALLAALEAGYASAIVGEIKWPKGTYHVAGSIPIGDGTKSIALSFVGHLNLSNGPDPAYPAVRIIQDTADTDLFVFNVNSLVSNSVSIDGFRLELPAAGGTGRAIRTTGLLAGPTFRHLALAYGGYGLDLGDMVCPTFEDVTCYGQAHDGILVSGELDDPYFRRVINQACGRYGLHVDAAGTLVEPHFVSCVLGEACSSDAVRNDGAMRGAHFDSCWWEFTGGDMVVNPGARPTFTGCHFDGSVAPGHAGQVILSGSGQQVTLINCFGVNLGTHPYLAYQAINPAGSGDPGWVGITVVGWRGEAAYIKGAHYPTSAPQAMIEILGCEKLGRNQIESGVYAGKPLYRVEATDSLSGVSSNAPTTMNPLESPYRVGAGGHPQEPTGLQQPGYSFACGSIAQSSNAKCGFMGATPVGRQSATDAASIIAALKTLGLFKWVIDDWTQPVPVASPSARSSHAMAYDPVRGVTVMFGGYDGANPLADTWTWDGVDWTQAAPAHSPPVRWGHCAVYDSSRGVVVVFGGTTTAGAYLDDTWEWDGSDWVQVVTAHAPNGRRWFGSAYDSNRRVLVIYAGRDVVGPKFDTWEFDGVDWTEIVGMAHTALVRMEHSMCFDPLLAAVVLFGGIVGGVAVADTYLYDGTDWLVQAPASNPSARSNAAMVYDGARKVSMLFGGDDGAPDDETWELTVI